MGDAVVRAEVAALISSLSPGSATGVDADISGAVGVGRRNTETGREVNFRDFVHLFRNIF